MDTNLSQYMVDSGDGDGTHDHGEDGSAFSVQDNNGVWHWDLTSDEAATLVGQIAT